MKTKPNIHQTSAVTACFSVATITCLMLHSAMVHAAIAGKVQFTYGNVKATTPSGVTRWLAKGGLVNEGDSISTASTSSAQIKMMDGGLVAIRPDTKMKFDKFVFNGKQDGTERGYFTLLKGGFRAVTGLVGKVNKHNYKITTPTATIGIRGTDHETYVVPQASLNAAAGAYSKVNVGETTLTTNLGTVNVLPNQMGFSSGMNDLPKLQPINTNLFTVSVAPTKTIKEAKQEKKEADAKKAAEKQSTPETKQTAKAENKKAATQEAKQVPAQDTTQASKQETASATAEESESATKTFVAFIEQLPATASGEAGNTGAAAEAAPLRTDTKMDAPSNIMAVAAAAPAAITVPVVESVAAPVTPTVVDAKPVVTVAMSDTSGNTLDATNQTVTNSANPTQSVTVTAVVEVIAANPNPASPTTPVSIATAVAKVINPVITDTIANLLNSASVATNTDVQVTDSATLIQLATLQGKIGAGVMTYGSVIDNLANLNTNAGGYVVAGKSITVRDTITNLTANPTGYPIAGKNVVVTDAASIAQLAVIDASNNTGNVTALTVNDTAANLASNTGGYIAAGKNVSVTDVLTIAQLTAIDAVNGTGALAYTALSDTAATLAASTYVTTGKNVTVTNAATVAQLTAIDTANGAGALTYTALTDIAATLVGNSYVTAGKAVTVTNTATLTQLGSIDTANGVGIITYTVLNDTVANLNLNTGGYVAAGKNVTVTDAASIAQLAALDTTNTTGTVTATTVTDTVANLTTNTGGYVAAGMNVAVTDAASIAQLATLDTTNTTGTVTATAVTDTVANLTTNTGGYVAAGKNVTVTDAASIAQLTALDVTNTTGTVSVNAVIDTVANLTTNTGGYVVAGRNVTVTDAASIAQLAALDATNTTGSVSASTVSDTVANLTSNTGGYVAAGKNVAVTDAASIAQLTALDATNTTGTVTTTAVTDTVANLTTNTGGYVAAGKSVIVTDAASIAQLAALDVTNTTGSVTATAVTDTVANLTTNTGGYVAAGKNVSVTDTATIAQLTAIDTANGTGTLTYISLSDAAATLAASAYVTAGKNIAVTGTATTAQLGNIDAANGAGTLTYTTLGDTVANLTTNTGGYVAAGKNVIVTDAASIAQLAALDATNTTGTVTATAVTDTVANLTTNTGGYVAAGKNVIVTDAASIAQLTALDATNTTGTVAVTAVTDTVTNLTTNTGGYVAAGKNVTVTDAASITQLAALDATNTTGTVTATTVNDTVANLTTNTGGYVAAGKNVGVTDTATVAQLTAIDTANGSGTLVYTALNDTAATLASSAYVTSGKIVTVSDAGNIAQLAAIKLANGGASLTYTALTDTAANLATNAGNFVASGKNVTVTDTATVGQLTTIDAANVAGTLAYTALADTAATLDGSAYVTTGKNITVTNAATLAQLSNIDSANGTGSFTYTALSDTVTNLNTNANGYLVAGKNVEVTDTASLAQLAALDAVNAAGSLSFTTVNNANAAHRVLFEPTVTGGKEEGWLWGVNPVASSNTTYGFDANKNLVQIQGTSYETWDQTALVQSIVNSNIVFNGGTSSDNFAATDGSIYMGRWTGGSMTVTDLATASPIPFTVNAGTTSTHWLLAQMPAEVSPGVSLVRNMVGTANYTMTAATHPTDTFGNVGLVNAASLTANFTAQTLATTAQFTFSTTDTVNISNKNRVFNINQSGIAFDANSSTFQTFGGAALPSVVCTGADCGGYWFAGLEGSITGGAGLTAFVDYNFYNSATPIPAAGTPYTDMVRSIVAFSTATAPTVGTNPPAGNYISDFIIPYVIAGGYSFVMPSYGNILNAVPAVNSTSANITLDAAGNVSKSFNVGVGDAVGNGYPIATANLIWTGGVAAERFQSMDGSIVFGRWLGGSVTVADAAAVQAPISVNLNQSGSMVGATSSLWAYVSPPSNNYVQRLLGSTTYIKTNSTTPFDSVGGTGVLNSASFSADFTNQKISAALKLTMNSGLFATDVFDLTASAVPIVLGGFSSMNTGSTVVTCSFGPCTGNLFGGYINGSFAGSTASDVLVAYGIGPNKATGIAMEDIVSGYVAFNTTAAPTAGTNPPFGATANWESFSHLAVAAGISTWNRGRFNAGLLPQTNTNFVLDGAGNLVTSRHVQYNERATWNSTGGFNNFADANVTYSGGVASDYFQVADGSLTIGRWTGGQMTVTDNNGILAPLVKNLGSTSAYWGLGTSTNPSVVQSLIGTTTFMQVGATQPTDTFGNLGTVPVATLVANFSAMTVDTSVAFTIANQNLSVAATAVSIVPGGNYFDATYETGNAPTVSCTGTCAGTGYLGWMSGSFFGAGAGSADVSYKIWPTAPQGSVVSDIIQGVVALSATTAPTVGANPPTGLYQYVTGRIFITSPTDVISGNAFNAAPLASSNIVLDAAGNVVRVSEMNVNTSTVIEGASVTSTNQQVTFSGGVAADYFKMADNSITFGRWLGGDLLIDDPVTFARTTVALKANDGITPTSGIWYFTTPLQSTNYVQSLTGASSYTNVADVRPTDSFGNVGTLTSATLTADFLAQTVDAATNFTIAGSTYDVSALGMPILIDTFTANPTTAIVPTVTCFQGLNACAGTYQGRLAGTFAGNSASSILLQYAAWPTTTAGVPAADIVRGLVAFDTAAPPTLAPTKVVAITMWDSNASNWLWNNTFTTLPGNINTAAPNPSFSFDWGGGNASGESLTLAGATGAVNGSATSSVTTGIQYGRYGSITSSTQANWGSFNELTGWNRTGQWAYGVSGYLDNFSTLSTATNGTITGQFGYVLDGPQSAPMDWNGNKGVLNSLSLTANFVTNTLNTFLQATQGETIWNASSTGVPISSFSPYFNAGGNGVGEVSTVTKGATGTESCTTCSWYLNGAFTGQNYAGAVVAFGLSDNSTSMSSSGLEGVAALTRTGGTVGGLANPVVSNATGTTAFANYVVATAGANTGVNVHTQTSATVNGNNVLTSFGSTAITCISCTGQLAPDFANTGIRLGTWDVGTSASSWTNTVSDAQFHWITGPTAPQFLVQALLGTANYTLDGGTAPTSQTQGVIGVSTGVINSANLTLDFNKQAVGLNFSVSSGAHNWLVSTPLGNEAPLGNNNGNGASSFAAATSMTGPGALSVMLDGVDVSSSAYISKVSGQITGDTLMGALFQYQLAGITSVPSTPSAIGTTTFTDSFAVLASSSTLGLNVVSFPSDATGTFGVQPATTVNLTSTNGTTISSLSTMGGVAMNVATFTQMAPDTYAGFDSVTGEGVEVTIFSGAYSNAFGGLAYSSYGWVRKHPDGLQAFTGPFANIYFAGGTYLTPTAAMPNAISATYSGGMQGAAQDSATNILYVLNGTTSLTADFTNSTILGGLTGIGAWDVSTDLAAGSFNDLAISGTISSVASSFSGSVTAGVAPAVNASPVAIATGAATTGTTSGHFYGPNAAEVSGTWALSSGTISASGAFGAANGTTVNPGLQTASGTVALVQTSVNGVAGATVDTATPARLVIETHIDTTNSFQASGDVNNATRVTTVAGAVTGFDLGSNNNNNNLAFSTSKAVSIGTATSVNVGSDVPSGFSWGRWSGGNLQYTDRVTNAVTSPANTNLHWIAGPTSTNVVLPVSGTFNYTLVGGTNPTDNLGNVGTLTGASLQANFTTQTVNMGVNATVNTVNYVANGTNMPIQNGGFSNNNGGTYNATANGTAVQGFAGGMFTGATGTGAGVVYGFANGATVVNGVAAFSRP